MINKIFIFLIVISIIYSIFTNRINNINEVILDSPKKSLEIVYTLGSMLIFWNGILEIAKQGGFLKFISKFIKKLITPLFKSVPKDDIVFDYLSGNIAANMLGLGSAATPMGLKAMKEFDRINNNSEVASKEMITMMILNTSGLTLIPTSIIALRKMYNSNFTTELIPYVVLMTLTTTIIALFIDYLFRRFSK